MTQPDREIFEAMRVACTALGVTIDELEALSTEEFAELYDAFADWWVLLPKAARS